MSQFNTNAATAAGITPRVDTIRRKLGIMLPGEGESASLYPAPKFSRLAVVAAGTSPDNTAKFSFFQNAFNPQTTNIRNPGKLSQQGLFLMTGVGFHIMSTGKNELVKADEAWLMATPLLKYLNGGYIRCEKNGRLIFDDYGLYKYPSGGGAVVSMAVNDTTLTTIWTGAVVNNGHADIRNRNTFKSPIVFTPNDVLDFSVDFGTVIPLLAGTGAMLTATIFGDEFADSDR